jgi:hypothetical protein
MHAKYKSLSGMPPTRDCNLLTEEVLAGAKAAAEPKRVRAVRSFILIETIEI